MLIRSATPSDLKSVVRLGIQGLESTGYKHMIIDRDKVEKVAIECISSPTNFCWVAEHDGEVVAAVSALVFDLMFYQRKQCNVVQFWSNYPGAGIKLIREFLKWARGRRAIKMIIFTLEANVDPRIGKLLKREGLVSEMPIYLEVR